MKKNLVFLLAFGFFAAFGLVACSPMAFNLAIDVKQHSSDVDLKIFKKDIAIYAFSEAADKDSVLVAAVAFGMAEKMEEDRGIASSSIPVFSIQMEEVNPSDVSMLVHAASFTNSEILVLVDSLSIGDYTVKKVPAKVYYSGGQGMSEVNLSLPFSFKFGVFDVVSRDFLYTSSYSDSLKWVLYAEKEVSDVKLISETNLLLKDTFNDLGERFAAQFSPQWKTEDRTIVYYDNSRWLEALRFAENFQWQKAMDVWMEEVKTGDPKKAAFSAYNIAVACEMLEDYGLAIKWLDYAASKYGFKEIGEIRAKCESMIGK